MKRGLSRLQNLFYYSQEMKVFDHSLCRFLLLLSVLSTHPPPLSETSMNRRMSGTQFTMFASSVGCEVFYIFRVFGLQPLSTEDC